MNCNFLKGSGLVALENTHWGSEAIERMLQNCKTVFFIGIGGVSMCSLAQITLADGMCVCGSDRVDGARQQRLREMGATVYVGHDAANIESADIVVYTVAVGEENPEYQAAKAFGKPLISRSDYLGYLMMRYPTRIGISGMNGKSTTTAMCAHLLMKNGDPTVFCGAESTELGGTCRIGRARDCVVFEACEYMDSFLDFSPTLALILNVEMDHVDYFHSMEQIRTSFRRYAEKAVPNGCAVINADCAETVKAMEGFDGKIVTFGICETADFRATDIRSDKGCRSFSFCRGKEELCRIRLCIPGDFQVMNALAAATVAYLEGLSPERIAAGLSDFTGIKRRMEHKGTLNGATVFNDYAHHPSAIIGTLEGAREMGYSRLLCAYQPHTYSRTAGLFQDFSHAFDAADRVYFTDIYAARETNESGVSSKQLAEAVGCHAQYSGDLKGLADTLLREAREGDLLIVMGAGDIEQVFDMLPLE